MTGGSVVVTGGRGFLGWHVRCALRERGVTAQLIPLGDSFDAVEARRLLGDADTVIHLAGVNRGSDDEVVDGNMLFARQLGSALSESSGRPRRIVMSGSVQSDVGGTYGDVKARAAEILRGAAASADDRFTELRIPNVFGEHGRPFYNSVTATFCHIVAQGGSPEIQQDREIPLVHAQDVADALLSAESIPAEDGRVTRLTVSELLRRIRAIAEVYASGEIPTLVEPFDRDLFNTYRSYLADEARRIPLVPRRDARGSFVEIVRARSEGQSSFSTTHPGVVRGDHFHRRKVERFTVISGSAVISLRRLFSDEILRIPVGGDAPASVDMPTMWAHNIENIGDGVLYTAFWANELFDPQNPDTIPEPV